jgi:hypothetical protein
MGPTTAARFVKSDSLRAAIAIDPVARLGSLTGATGAGGFWSGKFAVRRWPLAAGRPRHAAHAQHHRVGAARINPLQSLGAAAIAGVSPKSASSTKKVAACAVHANALPTRQITFHSLPNRQLWFDPKTSRRANGRWPWKLSPTMTSKLPFTFGGSHDQHDRRRRWRRSKLSYGQEDEMRRRERNVRARDGCSAAATTLLPVLSQPVAAAVAVAARAEFRAAQAVPKLQDTNSAALSKTWP